MLKNPPKYHKSILNEFYAEGNNGGDFIELTKGSEHDDNMVRLTVGHCCVHCIDVEIPVEVLTSILVDVLDGNKLENPNVLKWNKDVNTRLINQMEKENDNNN